MLPTPCHLNPAKSSAHHSPTHSSGSGPNLPCLHCPLDKSEDCFTSRLADDGFSGEQDHRFALSRSEAEIMSEVTDWLQSRYMDAFWTPSGMQPRKVIGVTFRFCKSNRYRYLGQRIKFYDRYRALEVLPISPRSMPRLLTFSFTPSRCNCWQHAIHTFLPRLRLISLFSSSALGHD